MACSIVAMTNAVPGCLRAYSLNPSVSGVDVRADHDVDALELDQPPGLDHAADGIAGTAEDELDGMPADGDALHPVRRAVSR